MKFPQHLRLTYTLWQIGEDLRSTLPSATYCRHGCELLAHGVDIALRQDGAPRSNVVSLVRILGAGPTEIPLWAFSERLIHASARR